jgi:hypothetical protein
VALLAVLAAQMQGCVLTKIVSVPVRVVGAAVSVVPIAGNTAHKIIDGVAEVIDGVPI